MIQILMNMWISEIIKMINIELILMQMHYIEVNKKKDFYRRKNMQFTVDYVNRGSMLYLEIEIEKWKSEKEMLPDSKSKITMVYKREDLSLKIMSDVVTITTNVDILSIIIRENFVMNQSAKQKIRAIIIVELLITLLAKFYNCVKKLIRKILKT